MQYTSRADAGRRLAASLEHLRGNDLVVLGLPRGGVPVAFEVAAALAAPLDVVLVRKLGVPWQPELAMGAIGEGDARVVNDDVLRIARVSKTALAMVEAKERRELERRAQVLRGGRNRVPIRGRTAVIVDDGMATGATAAVACQFVKKSGAARIVVAVPVAAPEAVSRLRVTADEVVCPYTPLDLGGVGNAYDDFHQLADSEVTDLLATI
ncbi:phosphoribosyltransferase [Rhodococcus oxybenzonivorans]|uniref:Phosphoribosyltransferase n=1 Tax=Rhodococcus oxybenzonivorans TaxID=1990687 RepID=A0A2S2BYF9_9NOCA|nr:phosphoribosyltransferase family protein [Rhodococcus oxybenzonivorans]AWK73609.1 phosphoribosyltransferase [Rhodococcus oxybenzonivorans]